MKRVVSMIVTLDALLLGRGTWEILAAHWPHVGEKDPIAAQVDDPC